MFSKLPTLAWSLLALTCLMVGTFLGEAQHQINAREPVYPTIGVAIEIDVLVPPTPTITPTPRPLPPSRN